MAGQTVDLPARHAGVPCKLFERYERIQAAEPVRGNDGRFVGGGNQHEDLVEKLMCV